MRLLLLLLVRLCSLLSLRPLRAHLGRARALAFLFDGGVRLDAETGHLWLVGTRNQQIIKHGYEDTISHTISTKENALDPKFVSRIVKSE